MVDPIIDFAELRDFIDEPVRTYSSGMYMRLAFAVATTVDPDVLVIDEILAVGDEHFQRKSRERIEEFQQARQDAGAGHPRRRHRAELVRHGGLAGPGAHRRPGQARARSSPPTAQAIAARELAGPIAAGPLEIPPRRARPAL